MTTNSYHYDTSRFPSATPQLTPSRGNANLQQSHGLASDPVQGAVHQKNCLLEELTRRHEDVLHVLEQKIRTTSGACHPPPSPREMKLRDENLRLKETNKRLCEELERLHKAHEQLDIQYQIQKLEVQKLTVQYDLELQNRGATQQSPSEEVVILQRQVFELQRELRDALKTLGRYEGADASFQDASIAHRLDHLSMQMETSVGSSII
uniref:Centrosomal protein of 162 kDa n=1 Tax=Eutreptiella gymnastica TaxID=73025 RepID=A0A7S4LLG1_9EUGL